MKAREEIVPYGSSQKTSSRGVAVAQLLDAPFSPGDVLTRDEFLRLWEDYPEIKFAELIGGVVYMPLPGDGIYRSTVFPGLWLNAKAVAAENGAAVLKTLEIGMKSAEYKTFARELAKRGTPKRSKRAKVGEPNRNSTREHA